MKDNQMAQKNGQALKDTNSDANDAIVRVCLRHLGIDESSISFIRTSNPNPLGRDAQGGVALIEVLGWTQMNRELGIYEEVEKESAQHQIRGKGIVVKDFGTLRYHDYIKNVPQQIKRYDTSGKEEDIEFTSQEMNAELFELLSLYSLRRGIDLLPVVYQRDHNNPSRAFIQYVGDYSMGELYSNIPPEVEKSSQNGAINLENIVYKEEKVSEEREDVNVNHLNELIARGIVYRSEGGWIRMRDKHRDLINDRLDSLKSKYPDKETLEMDELLREEKAQTIRERKEDVKNCLQRIYEIQDLMEESWKANSTFKQIIPKPDSEEDTYLRELRLALERINPELPHFDDIQKIFEETYLPILTQQKMALNIGDANADNFIKRGSFPYKKSWEGDFTLIETDHTGFHNLVLDATDYISYCHMFCGISHRLQNELWRDALSHYEIENDEIRPLMESFRGVKVIGSLKNLLDNSELGTPNNIGYDFRMGQYMTQVHNFFSKFYKEDEENSQPRPPTKHELDQLVTLRGEREESSAQDFFLNHYHNLGLLGGILRKHYLNNTHYDSKE